MGVPDPETDGQFYKGVPMRRLVAFLIDFAIGCVIMVVTVFLGFLFSLMTAGAGAPLAMLLIISSSVIYRWVMLIQRSATLGMIMTGIEVRDKDGNRMDAGSAFLHTIAFHVTFFTPLLLIGWILMATSPYRRAMHDIVIGSVVINRPS